MRSRRPPPTPPCQRGGGGFGFGPPRGGRKDVRGPGGSLRFDVQIPVMSLPGVLGMTLETLPARVPYLVVEEELVER